MSDPKPEDEDMNSLSYKIANLENYYADNVLSDELKEIYALVQQDCSDFRNDVFLRNVDIIEDNLGNLEKAEQSKLKNHKQYEEMLREIKTPQQLMTEYSKK